MGQAASVVPPPTVAINNATNHNVPGFTVLIIDTDDGDICKFEISAHAAV